MNKVALQKFADYLGLKNEPPTREFLKKIIPIHLEKVPYESLSKILSVDPSNLKSISLPEYVERMIQFGFGGTCFVNNIYFAELLKYLGFEVELNSIDTMGASDSHVTCKVYFDGEPFIVDFGNMTHFSGPFSLKPKNVQKDSRGDNEFIFTPNEDGQTYKMEFFRQGQLIRSHISKTGAKEPEYFHDQIVKTFRPDAYWMQILCICRHVGDTIIGIWDKTFFKQRGLEVTRQTLESVDQLKSVLVEQMNLPNIPVDDVLAKMKSYSGIELY